MKPMLTNIIAPRGWQRSPCIAPGTTVIPKRAKFVLIDHEADNYAIELGQQHAIDRAKRIISDVRLVTDSQIAWYGWPYPQRPEHVEPFASVFGPLVALADWLAPSLYWHDTSDVMLRASLFVECVAATGITDMPVIPCACDLNCTTEGICTDAEVAAQCKAARSAGASSLYLWSSLDYHQWVARHNVGPEHGAYKQMNISRATLMGTWGFCVSAWNDDEIDREYRRVSHETCKRFAKAWKRSKR